MKNSKKVEDRSSGKREHGRAFILLCTYLPLFLLTACYENREGCLDLRATNFDIDADRECDNCCVYPQLKLVFEHKVQRDSAANWTYNTAVYRDGAGNAFRVRDIQFYVSEARLVRADGTEVYPTDSLNVQIQLPDSLLQAVRIGDNVAIINRNNFAAAEMGRLVTTGAFTKVRFTLGLPDTLNWVLPNSLPDSLLNHPLENTAMYINADTGFVFNRLQIFNSVDATDTTFTTYRLFAPQRVEVELPLQNPASFSAPEGFHLRVIVRINYLEWFRNVNLKTDPPATVATKILQNLPNSFSVTRVERE